MADNADNGRVERTFHPNGQVETEVTYVGEHIEGVTRHWYENGTLQSETPMRNSRPHGTVREWDAAGNLLGESEFVDGTGIGRSFHANGVRAGETCMKNGIPHGYQRCWDESGELYVEVFYVNGRKVSRKRYEQARKEDPILPAPPADSVAGAVWPETAAAGPVVAIQRGEEELRELLAAGPYAEALGWLKESDGILGEGLAGAEAIGFVELFYKAGAEEVIAIGIDKDPDVGESAGKLVVKLPEDAGRRKKVLRICNSLNREVGFEAERDVGQRFVIVALD
jgi:antitoxin component YwqK of YwqJK toxin-antitoxin module